MIYAQSRRGTDRRCFRRHAKSLLLFSRRRYCHRLLRDVRLRVYRFYNGVCLLCFVNFDKI